jgi:hypothetical protein
MLDGRAVFQDDRRVPVLQIEIGFEAQAILQAVENYKRAVGAPANVSTELRRRAEPLPTPLPVKEPKPAPSQPAPIQPPKIPEATPLTPKPAEPAPIKPPKAPEPVPTDPAKVPGPKSTEPTKPAE